MGILFALLLIVPLLWLLRLPVRVVDTVRRRPYASMMAGAGALVLLLASATALHNSGRSVTSDYAPGDATLRAMLD